MGLPPEGRTSIGTVQTQETPLACLQTQGNIKEKLHMSTETSPTVTDVKHKPIRHVEVQGPELKKSLFKIGLEQSSVPCSSEGQYPNRSGRP